MGWDIDVREKVYQRLVNEIFFRIMSACHDLLLLRNKLEFVLPIYIKTIFRMVHKFKC